MALANGEWRMAARELIEDENVLSLEKVKGLFNHFFRKGHKIINQDTIEIWILHCDAKSRFFGITATAYRSKNAEGKAKARMDALEHFEGHYREIFQRRHDCIHNCDRPKSVPQKITDKAVKKVLFDLEFLVSRCNEAFLSEFPEYLKSLGFGTTTRAQVCT